MRKDKTTRLIIVENIEKIQENRGLTINQRNKIRQLLIDAFLKVQEGRSDEM